MCVCFAHSVVCCNNSEVGVYRALRAHPAVLFCALQSLSGDRGSSVWVALLACVYALSHGGDNVVFLLLLSSSKLSNTKSLSITASLSSFLYKYLSCFGIAFWKVCRRFNYLLFTGTINTITVIAEILTCFLLCCCTNIGSTYRKFDLSYTVVSDVYSWLLHGSIESALTHWFSSQLPAWNKRWVSADWFRSICNSPPSVLLIVYSISGIYE